MRIDLIALPDQSKVWIYQANRFTKPGETEEIQDKIINFTHHWLSHGEPVYSYGHLFHNRFLVLVADESNHVSGCSIDSSVHFIQNLGAQHGIDFFDRLNLLYFKNEDIESIPFASVKNAIHDGLITDETLVFNNLVKTKEEFLKSWVTPLHTCWMQRYLPKQTA